MAYRFPMLLTEQCPDDLTRAEDNLRRAMAALYRARTQFIRAGEVDKGILIDMMLETGEQVKDA